MAWRVAAVCLVAAFACASEASREPENRSISGARAPAAELHLAADEQAALAAARAIIASDPVAAMITLDANGQPRVRSVNTSSPEVDMTIWIATRPDTRKVEQIRAHPNVTLYYNDDATASYVSIMGTATVHTDSATLATKNFFAEEELRAFWPAYPENFVLIRVQPTWLEVTGHGISAHPENWRPQAVVFSR
jgi:general stress protein 26